MSVQVLSSVYGIAETADFYRGNGEILHASATWDKNGFRTFANVKADEVSIMEKPAIGDKVRGPFYHRGVSYPFTLGTVVMHSGHDAAYLVEFDADEVATLDIEQPYSLVQAIYLGEMQTIADFNRLMNDLSDIEALPN